MTTTPLKAAVVGTNIGCKLHVRALRGAGFEVVALVGRDAERTRARADHFGIPAALGSIDEVLDTDVDAVVVASPPATHRPFTLALIGAGKHVLCEKPFALDAAEAREMRDAANEAGVVGQVNHPNRWFAYRAELRELVTSGAIGAPIQATFDFEHDLINRGLVGVPDWWLDLSAGGGWLRNYAAHGIDLVRYLLGDVVAVAGSLHDDPSRGMTADDAYSFAFRLANGGQGVMAGTCRVWDFFDMVRITGTRGTAGYTGGDAWIRDEAGNRPIVATDVTRTLLLAGGDEPGAPGERLHEVGPGYDQIHSSDHGYPEQVCLSRSFRNRILDRSYAHPAVATFDDGVAHMAIIDAVEASSRSGAWADVAGIG